MPCMLHRLQLPSTHVESNHRSSVRTLCMFLIFGRFSMNSCAIRLARVTFAEQ